MTMINAKRIAQMAKKWQRKSSVVDKGHCAVYTADGRRFEVPLEYLSTPVFAELLRMSQEEFGFMSDRRITLPCDTVVMEYIMTLLKRNASAEVEKAFLNTIGLSFHYASCMAPSVGVSQQTAVYSC